MAPWVSTTFAPQLTKEDALRRTPMGISFEGQTMPFPPYCERPEGDDDEEREDEAFATNRPDSAFAFFSSPLHAPILDNDNNKHRNRLDDSQSNDDSSNFQSLPTDLALLAPPTSSPSLSTATLQPPLPRPSQGLLPQLSLPLTIHPPSPPQSQSLLQTQPPPPPYWTHSHADAETAETSTRISHNNNSATLLSPTFSAWSCSSSALSPRSLLSPSSPPSSHGSDANPFSPTVGFPWPPPSSTSKTLHASVVSAHSGTSSSALPFPNLHGKDNSSNLHRRDNSVSSVNVNLITLQDNEANNDMFSNCSTSVATSTAAAIRPSSSSSACWARRVDVTDYVIVSGNGRSGSKRLKNSFFHSRPSLSSFSSSGNSSSPTATLPSFHAFVVWTIRVQTLHGGSTAPLLIYKRYSEFDVLRRRLLLSFPTCAAALPPLPPKSVLHNFQPRFLEQRRLGLQYFLNCVLLNPEFSGSPVVKEFLFP